MSPAAVRDTPGSPYSVYVAPIRPCSPKAGIVSRSTVSLRYPSSTRGRRNSSAKRRVELRTYITYIPTRVSSSVSYSASPRQSMGSILSLGFATPLAPTAALKVLRIIPRPPLESIIILFFIIKRSQIHSYPQSCRAEVGCSLDEEREARAVRPVVLL